MRFREGMNGAGALRGRVCVTAVTSSWDSGRQEKTTLLPDNFLNCYFGKYLWLLQFRIKNIYVLTAVLV